MTIDHIMQTNIFKFNIVLNYKIGRNIAIKIRKSGIISELYSQ